MIKISNLNKTYGDKKVLKNINLEIDSGSIFGLLGPNGAGKSTLISTLVGLTPQESGEISVKHKNLKEELAYVQSISSLIPQNLAFYPLLSTKENLEFFGGMLGLHGNILKSRIEYVVDIAKLNEVYNQEARTYSGGLKRRLNIAIGLLNNPKIIYFDEPTVGIDPQSRNFILESIKAMKQENRIIVYTSHYMQEVEFLCDKIAIIDRGEIIKEGSLSSLLIEFKATVKTANKIIEVELESLSKVLEELKKEDQKIESINYGHDLESYFLSLTDRELRDY